jgi:glutamine amidotransferase
MCRILLVQSETPFSIAEQLKPFAELSKNSQEFQGHGWGCSWLPDIDKIQNAYPTASNPHSEHSNETSNANFDGKWHHYRNINPLWDCDLTDSANNFGSTKCLLVHARSAFRDEGIAIENNMPFSDGGSVFIFNGELRGVKIKSEGRIGAEKIYNYVRRMDKGDKHAALEKAVSIIEKRTSYIRAMNIIFSDGVTSVVSSTYSETPGYFQMHRSVKDGMTRVCSKPFPGEKDWQLIPNNITITI